MNKTDVSHTWLRISVVICTAVTSIATAAAPALGQTQYAEDPPARVTSKTDGLIEIRAGELPGRVVGGEQIDVKGCLQNTISDTVKTRNNNEATLSTEGVVKSGAFLCGDGVAIDKQVIIAGTSKELIKLSDSKSGLTLKSELVKSNPDSNGAVGISLFSITDGVSVVEKVKSINLYLKDRLGINVVATPNYETASKVTGLYGGSPSMGGSPSGPKGLARTEADFKSQWAWDAINKPASVTVTLSGKGVVVGVFDAFCTPAAYLNKEGTVVKTARFATIDPGFKADPKTKKPIENVCSHGEFVWSLSHEIAPAAQYFFYPVLDESGLGDTATLIAALEQFVTTTQSLESRKGSKDLQGVVINLSLNINSIQGDLVPPLQVEIARLIKLGAVVVAAAGNDSNTSEGIRPMRLPATYSNVIAVASVAKGDQRASYSNWVAAGGNDLSAPGGDGDCRTTAGAPYCVIGKDSTATMTICRVILGRGICIGRRTIVTGYRAWTGTSFATPLVSGLAALVIEKGNYTVLPADVAHTLATNATPVTAAPNTDEGVGDGVINVMKTAP